MRYRAALLVAAAGAATLSASLAPAEGARGAVAAALRLPGPGPQLRPQRLAAPEMVAWNGGCEHCHEAIASEWRTSRHHAAFTNGSFQAALEREPEATRAFCVGCHAPESRSAERPDAAAEIGVGCITCHVLAGPVVAADKSGHAPHATTATPGFRSAEACKSCHEFDFPGHRSRGASMQRTVSEHEASGSSLTCSSCHMPATAGHKSHAFPGGYDEALVRSALEVVVEQHGETARLTLTTKNVTHAVPTGDLFRRLAVEVIPVAVDGSRAEPVTRYLARHYRGIGRERVEVDDDRPHLVPRTVVLDLPAQTRAGGFDWVVRYERVGFHPGDDEARAEVESAFVIASGGVR